MIELISKGTELLIPLADVKLYLRVTDTAEDALITSFIQAAQDYIESYTSRAITINTYIYTLDERNCAEIRPTDRVKLQVGKIVSLISVKTFAVDNTETIEPLVDFTFQNFDQYSYVLTTDASSFPIGAREYNPLEIEFTAGFTAAPDLPFDLQQTILKLVANYYEYRESFSPENMTEVPAGMRNTLNKYRIEFLGVG